MWITFDQIFDRHWIVKFVRVAKLFFWRCDLLTKGKVKKLSESLVLSIIQLTFASSISKSKTLAKSVSALVRFAPKNTLTSTMYR